MMVVVAPPAREPQLVPVTSWTSHTLPPGSLNSKKLPSSANSG
jgi:hypothetical protein